MRKLVRQSDELHQMQLVAISTAAIGNTRSSVSHRITRDSPYWTVAYNDVCHAVNREMDYRERLAEVEAERDRLKRKLLLLVGTAL